MKHNEEIAGVFAEHYSELVSVEEEPMESVTDFLGEYRQYLGTIPEEKAEKIGAPFTEGELEQILKELKPISCPGPDGISNRLLQKILSSWETNNQYGKHVPHWYTNSRTPAEENSGVHAKRRKRS